MRSDSLRPVAALVTIAALATLPIACVQVVSGDQEFVDEFAAFKARGSVCAAAPVVAIDDGSLLANADRYRWLAYGNLLDEVVSPSGNVRYLTLNGDGELLDAARLTASHVAQVKATNLQGQNGKLAFWLNAYNALVLEAAARGFGADPGFTVETDGYAFFDHEIYVVGGETLSLNQIENGIIRGDVNHAAVYAAAEDKQILMSDLHDNLWGGAPPDPRVHFVINCASSSCPSQLDAPLEAETLDDVLDAATDAFLHDDARGAGPEGISQIFQFYFTDFELVGGVDAFISTYRPLSEVDTSRLLPYDWSLNLASD